MRVSNTRIPVTIYFMRTHEHLLHAFTWVSITRKNDYTRVRGYLLREYMRVSITQVHAGIYYPRVSNTHGCIWVPITRVAQEYLLDASI